MNHVDEYAAPDMPSGTFFVLYRLADRAQDHSGEDWTCFPSVETQAAGTRLSRSAVERHLAALVADGWISRKRRVRPDGRKGLYDYTVHRSPERRAALRAARAAIRKGGGKVSETLEDLQVAAANHAENCSMDHAAFCGATMLRFGAEPCGDSPHLIDEPKIEPKEEPTLSAREPGDAGFERVQAVWPHSGLVRTDYPKARAAFARWAGEVGADALVEAATRCAADPQFKAGSHGWPGLDRWLSAERWRPYLGAKAATVEPAAAGVAGPRFPDEALRAAVVAATDEAFAVSYLDRAGWDVSGLRVLPKTATAAEALKRRAGRAFQEFGAVVAAQGGTDERHG